MTQTLTTDRLKQIASGDAFICTQDDESVAMACELLANREAQPVGEEEINAALRLHRLKVEGHSQLSDAFRAGFKHARRAAPPAPAVPDAISTRQAITNMERHELCGSINVAYKHGWNDFRAAMLAQPVSQGCELDGGENCWSCGKHFTYAQHSECDGYCPHCDSPVDLGDEEDNQSKVVPAEPTEEMISSAWREAAGKCDHETIKRMYATMLAAAPEGGN